MKRKGKVLAEIKLKVVEDYLAGKIGVSQIAEQLHVSCYSVLQWIRKYKAFGYEGLVTKHTKTKYSNELKLQAVNDYMNAKGSLYSICFRYNISSRTVLETWIKQYNGHKIFTKGANIMTNGRKTTYEERVQIVSFCIANANDYNLTANEYKVSYQQVYTWVKKYNANGYAALVDRRGKHKSFEELSESEKIAAQFKLLEAENRRLKMENDFLKKLQEIERR